MRTAAFLLSVALLVSCKSAEKEAEATAQAVAAPYRERLTKHAAALEAARKSAAAFAGKVPRVTLGNRPSPTFASNAVLVFAKSQSYVSREQEDGLPLVVNELLHPPKEYPPEWAHDSREQAEARVKLYCNIAIGHRYAVVIRVLDEQQARLTGWKTFEGGQLFADALVFDLEDGAMLGGYPVLGLSRASIHVKSDWDTPRRQERVNEDLVSSLIADAKAGLDAELRAPSPSQ